MDKWYTFKDEDHLIPGSTPLGFRGNYASLGPQETGWKNLVGVQVGRKALMEAADILSNYDPDVTKEEDLKVALLRVLVMIPEAQRFFAVRKLVYNSWENGGVIDEDCQISGELEKSMLCIVDLEQDGSWEMGQRGSY